MDTPEKQPNPLEAMVNASATSSAPVQTAGPVTPLDPVANKAEAPADLSFFDKEKTAENKDGFADNIVKLTTDTKEVKPILGDVPTLDAAIIDRSFMQKKKLKNLYAVFGGLILLFGVSAGFFYSQLSPNFTLLGANPVQLIESMNQEIVRVQTDLNEATYLSAQMRLNAFAFRSNQYHDFRAQLESPKTAEPVKESLQGQVTQLREQLLADVMELQKFFKRSLTAPIFNLETLAFVEDVADMESRTRSKFVATNAGEQAELYQSAATLIGNQALIQAITNADVNALTSEPEQLDTLIDVVNEQVENEFSIVNTLKAKRVNWKELLTDIINSTGKAEEGLIVANKSLLDMNLYQAGGTSAILYSNYTINGDDGRISISGTLKTPDEKTFTTMANLIESLNASPKFTDVNYRSFAKSGSKDEGYESNFRIEFMIQDELVKDEDFENKNTN